MNNDIRAAEIEDLESGTTLNSETGATSVRASSLVPPEDEGAKAVEDPAQVEQATTQVLDEDDGTITIECGLTDAANSRQFGRGLSILKAVLACSDGRQFDVVLSSEHDRFIVGRNRQESDAAIADSRVSRAHMAIGCACGAAYVRDLQSTNGTFVNGKRISGDFGLHSGDLIRLGRTQLVFRTP